MKPNPPHQKILKNSGFLTIAIIAAIGCSKPMPKPVEYHPKVKTLLTSLKELDSQCADVIRAYPNGKPPDGDALLRVNELAMRRTETAISDAIDALEHDKSLTIDPAVTAALTTYKNDQYTKVGYSERNLQQKLRLLEAAVESAGDAAATARPNP